MVPHIFPVVAHSLNPVTATPFLRRPASRRQLGTGQRCKSDDPKNDPSDQRMSHGFVLLCHTC